MSNLQELSKELDITNIIIERQKVTEQELEIPSFEDLEKCEEELISTEVVASDWVKMYISRQKAPRIILNVPPSDMKNEDTIYNLLMERIGDWFTHKWIVCVKNWKIKNNLKLEI